MPCLRVAVCTNRTPAAVAGSLAALRAQLPAERVALVTSGLRGEAVGAHGSAFDGPLLAEPLPGLSRARNRALAWCEDGDVIAFVDDDAEAMPGWAAALERRWREAPAAVACIGGPIRPRWAAPPPRWISPAITPALTLLDLGEEVRDLDPERTTVYGANVSFRARALREVGGFDPAFGHSGRRLFFSEEDEAQRALARRGYAVRYVPDAGVWHVIPAERLRRRAFVRRRFWYGATLGLRGARRRGEALRVGARAAAGWLPALASGREALAMERAVRAAENAGVVLAPLVARRRG